MDPFCFFSWGTWSYCSYLHYRHLWPFHNWLCSSSKWAFHTFWSTSIWPTCPHWSSGHSTSSWRPPRCSQSPPTPSSTRNVTFEIFGTSSTFRSSESSIQNDASISLIEAFQHEFVSQKWSTNLFCSLIHHFKETWNGEKYLLATLIDLIVRSQ